MPVNAHQQAQNALRDSEIRRLFSEGWKQTAIAHHTGLTQTRISQICRATEARCARPISESETST